MSAVSSRGRLTKSGVMLTAILVVSALLGAVSAVLFQEPSLLGQKKNLTDFDSFYVAGTMANQGHANEAYEITETLAAQQALTGTHNFMPWTYPPPYTLLMSWLAHLPIGTAYALFTIVGLAFYLVVIRRIAGEYLPGALIAILPVVLLIVRTGQNGFFTGALVGCFLLAFLCKRSSAGVPLGIMILKPHLAAGIALLTLLDRRWPAIATAAAIVAVALAAATVAFGLGVWPAFLGGVHEAGKFLAMGYYPLFRMSSVYAAVRSFDVSPVLALVAHLIVALAGLGLLIHVWRRGYEPRVVAATACAASLLVSPYNYDYDLTILGVGIAFALPKLIEYARWWELLLLLLLSWFTTGYGFGTDVITEHTRTVSAIKSPGLKPDGPLSLTAFGLLPLILAGYMVLRRSAPEQGAQAAEQHSGAFQPAAAS